MVIKKEDNGLQGGDQGWTICGEEISSIPTTYLESLLVGMASEE